jgi:transposase
MNTTLLGPSFQTSRHGAGLAGSSCVTPTSAHKEIHLICDNYATHKHAKVKEWAQRNKRFHVHFTPTSASWLYMVERFFRDLSENRIKRGTFRSVAELIEAIDGYIAAHNKSPYPFIWTKSANDILQKVTRTRRPISYNPFDGLQ